jgi:hypothetical protein
MTVVISESKEQMGVGCNSLRWEEWLTKRYVKLSEAV